MDLLHNRQLNNVSKTEQSSLLCSNKDVVDCSVLGLKEELLLKQLAELVVNMYFHDIRNSG
ncbi:hypothetical protein HDC91_003257 [Mucilaginibacter sp. AK015]|nr:hypothetical protein [Mucilaginibacter sp. AK015]